MNSFKFSNFLAKLIFPCVPVSQTMLTRYRMWRFFMTQKIYLCLLETDMQGCMQCTYIIVLCTDWPSIKRSTICCQNLFWLEILLKKEKEIKKEGSWFCYQIQYLTFKTNKQINLKVLKLLGWNFIYLLNKSWKLLSL